MYFEDFLSQGGHEDLFAKAQRCSRYLEESGDMAEQALGLQLLAAPEPQTELRDRQGEVRRVIMLGSNSYLGLGRHPRVMAAAQEALQRYGYGMGAVSLYAGITELHRELEQCIASFLQTEEALVFPSGYGTNVGVISALCGPGDVIINDSANHASIFDGARLSGAELKVYPHGNMDGLARILSRLPARQKGRLIITDGVFSMHGDLAPLDYITALAARYQARVMVDDAHGLGIVGPQGRGTAAFFNVDSQIDLQVGMLSKAPAGLGGYCAGSRELINYLRLYARPYFFSTAMPAPVAAGLIEVFKLFAEDIAGRAQLWHNVHFMRERIRAMGFQTTPAGQAGAGIIPIIIGDEARLAHLHRTLLQAGVYTNIVSYPAVRRKECRLRLCVMATLSPEDMNMALDRLEAAGRQCALL